MQPLAPMILKDAAAPNWELLRRVGWSVANISGAYVVPSAPGVAWRSV